MKKKFKRDIQSLKEIHKLIERFVEINDLDSSWVNLINLVLEELFVNTVKYNPDTSGDISIELKAAGNQIIITLAAPDVAPFDITRTKEFDINQHIKKLRIGGLGIPLVKRMMDDIQYDYNKKTRSSTITLTKYLEDRNV